MGSPDQMQQATEGLARELKAALGWHGSTVLKTLPLNSRLFGAIEPEMCAGNHLRCALIAKETYSFCKRDLFTWRTRPAHVANEPYSHVHPCKETVYIEEVCTAEGAYSHKHTAGMLLRIRLFSRVNRSLLNFFLQNEEVAIPQG